MKKILIGAGIFLVVLIFSGMFLYKQVFAPTESSVVTTAISKPDTIEILATDLSVPWDIAQLPTGEFLITERTGSLVLLNQEKEIKRVEVPKVSTAGEGGLMGIALHPDFQNNRFIYLYRTVLEGGVRLNEVARYKYGSDHTLSGEKLIVSDIPGASNHDGGALSFGPDGLLYIATGDASTPEEAQNKNSLAGKILRVTDEGAVPESNPFNTMVYSYGHRNPQGLAWDSSGQLWATEHGRSGAQSGLDELNRIEIGGNYGWPDSQGDEVQEGTIAPTKHSGTSDTWAPGSLTASGQTLYFAGLRGQRLYKATILSDDSGINLEAFFPEEYGRIRAAKIFDSTLYITTSNTDGRGSERADDDKLIAIPISNF